MKLIDKKNKFKSKFRKTLNSEVNKKRKTPNTKLQEYEIKIYIIM